MKKEYISEKDFRIKKGRRRKTVPQIQRPELDLAIAEYLENGGKITMLENTEFIQASKLRSGEVAPADHYLLSKTL